MGRKRNTEKFDHYFFHEINSEEKAYWLGFLFADGCVHDTKKGSGQVSLHLARKDAEHLEHFHKAIGSQNKVHKYQTAARSVHCSDVMCGDLKSHGCTPRKSLTLEFPVSIPSDLKRHFLRGYFDGDGSVCLVGDRPFVNFVGTEKFLESIRSLLSLTPKARKHGNAYILQVSSRNAVSQIDNYLYSGSTVYLARKKLIFDKIRNIPKKKLGRPQKLLMTAYLP